MREKKQVKTYLCYDNMSCFTLGYAYRSIINEVGLIMFICCACTFFETKTCQATEEGLLETSGAALDVDKVSFPSGVESQHGCMIGTQQSVITRVYI